MKQRVLTAVILIAFVLAALFSTAAWPSILLAIAFYVTGLREIARLLGDSPYVWVSGVIWPIIFTLAYAGQSPLKPTDLVLVCTGVFVVGALASAFACQRRHSPIGLAAFGWVGGPIGCLVALHHLGEYGGPWRFANPVLLSMVTLWAGDTAAILAGRAFGRHPLWASLSPNKTWEGSAANLLTCVIVAIGIALGNNYSWQLGLACGVAAGTVGQYGDLFESYVKRQAGFKDSGSLLPGHGGILDRIDSMLFAAPAIALIVFFWNKG